MLSHADLSALRDRLASDADLAAHLATLRQRAAGVTAAAPHLPRVKALLSRDGGFCPRDGATLVFNPASPEAHRCPRCGELFTGERHYRNWARAQHLWLAERIAELGLIGAIADDADAARTANALLRDTAAIYHAIPNRDNVLGPTHLFFSTYLESVWLVSWLAGAVILREAGMLDEETETAVSGVADEAAGIIASFNEGLSNRQTWHAAALTAIGAWFGDEELLREAVEARTGLLGHLADGFGDDGLWYEGENYHLFALRGAMMGLHWSQYAGYDLLGDPAIRAHFRLSLLAPTRSALPDFTYPARRDARFGVSLAYPASLDLWEIGRGWLGADPELDAWLHTLYRIDQELPPADHADYWLHNAGRAVSTRPSRTELSWWALPFVTPPATAPAPWQPAGTMLASQGLAVLRNGTSYASLECGAAIGGHGHPDRLHLTLHAQGVHWLPDQGTGSYVHPHLAWYRSALAHNAPLLGGANCGGADGRSEAFDTREMTGWARGRAGEVRRTLVLDGERLVDLMQVEGAAERAVELPWHLQGSVEVITPGRWEPATVSDPFAHDAERFVPATAGNVVLQAVEGGASLRMTLHIPDGDLLRLTGPALPTLGGERPFFLVRGRGPVQWTSVLDWSAPDGTARVDGIGVEENTLVVSTPSGDSRYQATASGLRITGPQVVELGGLTGKPTAMPRDTGGDAHSATEGFAPRIEAAPALDGTLDGFDLSAPLILAEEHQYRRSETPWDPDSFSAEAWLNWDGSAMYLAVAVSKPSLVFRPADAPPLLLDNESDDIHSDGLQLHWLVGGARRDLLVVPEPGGAVRVRSIGPARKQPPAVSGRWSTSHGGYLVTLRIDDAALATVEAGTRFRFDLLVNEMLPERERRAGQLVWGGSGGWVYLRGDRHELREAGIVTLE